MIPTDTDSLARDVILYLIKLLPYLKKGATFVWGEIQDAVRAEGKKAVGESVKALWRKFWPKAEADPAAKAAVEKVAQNPEDQTAQTNLEIQLKRLLQDEKFRAEITSLLTEVKKEGVIVHLGLDIEEHSGKLTGMKISSGEELQKGNISELNEQMNIKKTTKDSEITGYIFGSETKENPSEKE